MKPTLVLGLALAANAMVADQGDNELIVAPTGKLAEWAKQHPHVMFDEVADDELAMKYVHLPHMPAPEVIALDDDEFYVPVVLAKYDEVADDELAIYQRVVPAEHIAFDDDELVYARQPRDEAKVYEDYMRGLRWINRPRDESGHPIKSHHDILAKANRFDEVADDELGVKYVHLPAAETQAFDDDELAIAPEQYQRLQNIRNPIYSRFDEVADDEFAINQQIIQQNLAFDDDELLYARQQRDEAKVAEDYHRARMAFNRPKYSSDRDALGHPTYNPHKAPIQANRFDEVADDELGVKYVHLPIAETQAFDDDELAIAPEQYQRLQNIRNPIYSRFDEVADDELAMAPEQYQRLQNVRNPIYSRFDEVADDEFAINQQIIQQNLAFDDADDEFAINQQIVQQNIAFDDADDEFAYVPMVLAKYDEVADDELAIYQQIVQQHVAYDDADDEFYVPVVLAKYDEVADDELAYLGHLLNEKTEKSSHGKNKEKTQPKRKLRPVVDEAPLAQH